MRSPTSGMAAIPIMASMPLKAVKRTVRDSPRARSEVGLGFEGVGVAAALDLGPR